MGCPPQAVDFLYHIRSRQFSPRAGIDEILDTYFGKDLAKLSDNYVHTLEDFLEAVHQARQNRGHVEFDSEAVYDFLEGIIEPFYQPLINHYHGLCGVSIALHVANEFSSMPRVFANLLAMGEDNFLSPLQPRLDHDQTCYELIKYEYYEYTPINDTFNTLCSFVDNPWASLSSIFASPTWSNLYYMNPAPQCGAELVLEVKALLNLHDLERALILGPKVPFEIITMIREELAMPLVKANRAFLLCLRRGDSLESWAPRLGQRVRILYECVTDDDEEYWRMFRDHVKGLVPFPDDFGRLLRSATFHAGVTGPMTRGIELIFPIVRDAPKVVDWVLNYIDERTDFLEQSEGRRR